MITRRRLNLNGRRIQRCSLAPDSKHVQRCSLVPAAHSFIGDTSRWSSHGAGLAGQDAEHSFGCPEMRLADEGARGDAQPQSGDEKHGAKGLPGPIACFPATMDPGRDRCRKPASR